MLILYYLITKTIDIPRTLLYIVTLHTLKQIHSGTVGNKMKYTLKQLHSKTNDELNEIVAQAQGFIKIPSGNDIETGLYGVKSNNETTTFRYLPTARTTEGKAQAFDLMIGCELEFSSEYKGEYSAYSLQNDDGYVEGKNPQRSIVIAAILHIQIKKEKSK